MLVATALAACNAILGIDDRKLRPPDGPDDDASTADGDRSDANGDPDSGDAAVVVIDDAGPGLAVVIGTPGGFAIDTHEVTVDEYRAFLDGGGFDAGHPACTWNVSFAPGCAPSPDLGDPMTCIDWCDAYAYCASKGKRLCGRIGGTSQTVGELGNAATDEWTRACAGGLDADRFAYGPTADPARCNVLETDAGGLWPTGSAAACVGATPGVFDLSGNAWEWEDACSDGGSPQNDGCGFRGGSFLNPVAESKCTSGTFVARNIGFTSLGFRCCKGL